MSANHMACLLIHWPVTQEPFPASKQLKCKQRGNDVQRISTKNKAQKINCSYKDIVKKSKNKLEDWTRVVTKVGHNSNVFAPVFITRDGKATISTRVAGCWEQSVVTGAWVTHSLKCRKRLQERMNSFNLNWPAPCWLLEPMDPTHLCASSLLVRTLWDSTIRVPQSRKLIFSTLLCRNIFETLIFQCSSFTWCYLPKRFTFSFEKQEKPNHVFWD